MDSRRLPGSSDPPQRGRAGPSPALLLFAGAAALIGAAAILVRLPLFPFVSGDYGTFVGRWYRSSPPTAASSPSNYKAPYLTWWRRPSTCPCPRSARSS